MENGTIQSTPPAVVQTTSRLTRARAKKANINVQNCLPMIQKKATKRKLEIANKQVSKKIKISSECQHSTTEKNDGKAESATCLSIDKNVNIVPTVLPPHFATSLTKTTETIVEVNYIMNKLFLSM